MFILIFLSKLYLDIFQSLFYIIYCKRKDISCELCKEKLPDYIKKNGRYYNITFYKPKFEEYLVLESMRADGHKTKFIHIP